MARPIFWPSDGSYTLGFGGNPYAAVPVRIYTRQTGGTQVTDLVAVAADGTLGAAIPSGILVSDANGLIPAFAGPDSGATTLWGDHGYGAVRIALTCDPTAAGGGGAVSSVVGQTGAVTGAQILADGTVAGALTAKADAAATTSALAAKADAAATTTALNSKAATATTITAGTGLTGGGDLTANRTLAVAYGTASGTAAQGNDARLSDTRTPTDGTVSLAKLSFDVATQVELDALATAVDAAKADKTTTITAGTGLSGGGDLSTNRTLTVAYGTTSTTATVGNDTRVVNAVQSTTITAIVKLTQAAYDALGTPDAATLYVIVG